MPEINPEFIERYQLILEKDPSSRVFAPLAEAYRKLGLQDQALELCRKGVEFNPHFASGRVALAKILIDKESFSEALEHLYKAIELSPDNILAHRLLANALIKLKKPMEALKSYKMILFINPSDKEAQKAVQKWEFLQAIEFEDELFEFVDKEGFSVFETDQGEESTVAKILSLADALTIREEFTRAQKFLVRAYKQFPNEQIEKRLKLLQTKAKSATPVRSTTSRPSSPNTEKKKKLLSKMLHRIKRNQSTQNLD